MTAETQELSELLALRRAKLDKIRELGVDPFGSSFPNTESSISLAERHEENRAVRYAGRILSHRDMGKSHFLHLGDQSGKFQIYVQTKNLDEQSQALFKLLDLGDTIGVEGTLFVTKTGEKSIKVDSFRLLSKSLLPPPAKWHGLSDVEQRYRQRYLDLISNPEVKNVLTLRCEIVQEIRRYLQDRGFLEVETPMMQAVAGGAAAQPFVTHHKALDLQLYLRIAPELYLKRLLVGGYEKIFELNRNFRNEGISRKHNPEFTMLEAYWAYADFEIMADLVEGLIVHLAQKFRGGTVVEPLAETGEKRQINLTSPWPRKRYRDCIKEVAGAGWFNLTPEQRRAKAEELGVEIGADLADFEVTNQVFEKLVEAKTFNPLFVTHLPAELVPLAKANAEDPTVVDVYELIINGQEISPGYSELNDPVAQRERLLAQAGTETQKLDEDFLTALENGMPPAGGIGIGIDRLVMLLTGAESIRDVIFFPLLKPRAS
jgi:lysyl-tRNA synthetase class 2